MPYSLNATAVSLHALEPVLQQEKQPQWEACTSLESSPYSQQLEKTWAQQRRPSEDKNK